VSVQKKPPDDRGGKAAICLGVVKISLPLGMSSAKRSGVYKTVTSIASSWPKSKATSLGCHITARHVRAVPPKVTPR